MSPSEEAFATFEPRAGRLPAEEAEAAASDFVALGGGLGILFSPAPDEWRISGNLASGPLPLRYVSRKGA